MVRFSILRRSNKMWKRQARVHLAREQRAPELALKLDLDEDVARVLAVLEHDPYRTGYLLAELSVEALVGASAVQQALETLEGRQLVSVSTGERANEKVYRFTSLSRR